MRLLANLDSLCRTITELLQRFGYKKEAKFPHKYGGYFRNDADHRDFVGIGTAAGQSMLLVVLCQAYVGSYVCHCHSVLYAVSPYGAVCDNHRLLCVGEHVVPSGLAAAPLLKTMLPCRRVMLFCSPYRRPVVVY